MQRMVSFIPPDPPPVAPEDEWVCTRSGRRFFPLDPQPAQIAIEDIAYGLAGRYRFGAQSPRRYTVAQHSVEVCRQLARLTHNADVCLWGLLHDAAEAWLVDWQRPVKWRQFWWDGERAVPFAEIEFKVLVSVQKTFALTEDYLLNITALSKAVDAADRDQLHRERRDLFDDRQPVWGNCPAISPLPPLPAILDPDAAEAEFLAEFWHWFSKE